MKSIVWLLGLLVLVGVGAGAFIWSGAYDIAADEPHWPLTAWVMNTTRERSIAARASGIVVPDLNDESQIRTGAGNYDAMCAGCHLQPGVDRSELSNGLYPTPPNLSRRRFDDPAAAFWAIKHGIKMTGMPAWGKSMDDEFIWGMVAFLQQLPKLSEAQYSELVESSGGHSHSKDESEADAAEAADAHDEKAATHTHADETPHEH